MTSQPRGLALDAEIAQRALRQATPLVEPFDHDDALLELESSWLVEALGELCQLVQQPLDLLAGSAQGVRVYFSRVTRVRMVNTLSPLSTPPRPKSLPLCQFERPSSGRRRANCPSTQRVKPSPTNGALTVW